MNAAINAPLKMQRGHESGAQALFVQEYAGRGYLELAWAFCSSFTFRQSFRCFFFNVGFRFKTRSGISIQGPGG